MAIEAPGKRYGKRLAHSKVFGHPHGAKSVNADLNVTPLVDMFVILVLFLIANFSATGEILSMSKDIELPEAANTDELQIAPVVQVSKDQVIVSGTSVGRVEDLTREDYLNIPALEEKLRDMKKQFEDLHNAANDSGAFKGDVNIQADKKVQFRIIKRVMFSCAAAGYGNIAFATMSASQAGEKKPETAMRD
ncbi:MAG: biopolymer transporter ExbD [Myxococcaceae bacterium]|jgi:biopolymer transport protein ExbD|nr:biopolymer transporter ExbD [Myxococcaceae bacterium]MCA3013213.1 biopolymer transporter ExbD [Myxococcaceae bacterium]